MRRSKERVVICLFIASVFGLFATLNFLKQNLMLAFLFGCLMVLSMCFAIACKQVRLEQRGRRVVVSFYLLGIVIKQDVLDLRHINLLRVFIKHRDQSGGRGLTVWENLVFIDAQPGSEKILMRIKEHNVANKQTLDRLITDVVGQFKLPLDDQR